MDDLTRLNLSHSFDRDISMYTSLTFLDLKYSRIKRLPDAPIQILNLSHNRFIKAIPLTVTDLDLTGNSIITDLSYLRKLTSLNLSYNKKIKRVPITVTCLNLYDNKVVVDINHLTNLTELDLSSNKKIKDPLVLPKLRKLSLKCNKKITDLSTLPSLEILDLSFNKTTIDIPDKVTVYR